MAKTRPAPVHRVIIEVKRVGGGTNLGARLLTTPGNKPVRVKGTNGNAYELATEPCDSIDTTVARAKALASRHKLTPIALVVPRLYLGVRA